MPEEHKIGPPPQQLGPNWANTHNCISTKLHTEVQPGLLIFAVFKGKTTATRDEMKDDSLTTCERKNQHKNSLLRTIQQANFKISLL